MSFGALAVAFVAIAFAGLLFWVLRPANKARFEAYASIPLRDGTSADEQKIGGDSP